MSILNILKSICILKFSLRKQLTFCNATTGLPRCLRNENRNSMRMTCHYQDLGSVSEWKFASTNTKHYPDLCSDMSTVWNILLLCKETSGFVRKCWRYCFLTLPEVWTCSYSIIFNSGHSTNIMFFFLAVCKDLIKLLECAGSVFYQRGLWSWL